MRYPSTHSAIAHRKREFRLCRPPPCPVVSCSLRTGEGVPPPPSATPHCRKQRKTATTSPLPSRTETAPEHRRRHCCSTCCRMEDAGAGRRPPLGLAGAALTLHRCCCRPHVVEGGESRGIRLPFVTLARMVTPEATIAGCFKMRPPLRSSSSKSAAHTAWGREPAAQLGSYRCHAAERIEEGEKPKALYAVAFLASRASAVATKCAGKGHDELKLEDSYGSDDDRGKLPPSHFPRFSILTPERERTSPYPRMQLSNVDGVLPSCDKAAASPPLLPVSNGQAKQRLGPLFVGNSDRAKLAARSTVGDGFLCSQQQLRPLILFVSRGNDSSWRWKLTEVPFPFGQQRRWTRAVSSFPQE
nr:hypothetical protein Itr_chr10CG13410 [Ipomoea trifida]